MALKSISIDDLPLTVRAYNCLAGAGILNVHKLARKTQEELLRLPNLGKTTVEDVERALGELGLWLGMRPSDIAAMEAVAGADGESPSDQPDGHAETDENRPGLERTLACDVAGLGLNVRARNCLGKGHIATVGDLVLKTRAELLRLPSMGSGTIGHIERALDGLGLRLGMRAADIAAVAQAGHDISPQDIDAFIRALEAVKGRCGIDSLEDLVGWQQKDLVALAGTDRGSLNLVEDRLRKWGIELGAATANGTPDSMTESPAATDIPTTEDKEKDATPRAATAREEVISNVERLSQRRPHWGRCFVAFHGLAGAARYTLQQLAERGEEYGFGRPVTRERIRQIVARTESDFGKLGRGAGRAGLLRLERWDEAVAKVKGRLPMSVPSFLFEFGYDAVADTKGTYDGLVRYARLLALAFPFKKKTVSGLGSLVLDPGDIDAVAKFGDIKEILDGAYGELSEAAGKLDCDAGLVRRVIDASTEWEFLDSARGYFWKKPKLPPTNYGITGNAILTSLCKVFSVARRATTLDLVQSVARDRMVRKGDQIREIPTPVLEGIAKRSGLFDVQDGQIVRKVDAEWCTVGDRDVALLKICVEHGRTVASNVLYSGLISGGLSTENAQVTVAYSPLLVHTRSGQGHKEGVYKFVPRPDDVDLDALTSRVGRVGGASERGEAPAVSLRIPISPRTRLSGRHVDSAPSGLDGTWEVQDGDGRIVGCISIRDRIVDGLLPVISGLGLQKHDVLELRVTDAALVVVAGP